MIRIKDYLMQGVLWKMCLSTIRSVDQKTLLKKVFQQFQQPRLHNASVEDIKILTESGDRISYLTNIYWRATFWTTNSSIPVLARKKWQNTEKTCGKTHPEHPVGTFSLPLSISYFFLPDKLYCLAGTISPPAPSIPRSSRSWIEWTLSGWFDLVTAPIALQEV